MKIITIIAAIMVLSACGAIDQQSAKLNGYSKICVDGVSYLQFTSGAAVQVDSSGKPVLCK